VNQAWDLNALPQQTTDKLAGQLVSMFDQLPLNEQNTLLSFRWTRSKTRIASDLKRYTQSYRDFPEMRRPTLSLLATECRCNYNAV